MKRRPILMIDVVSSESGRPSGRAVAFLSAEDGPVVVEACGRCGGEGEEVTTCHECGADAREECGGCGGAGWKEEVAERDLTQDDRAALADAAAERSYDRSADRARSRGPAPARFAGDEEAAHAALLAHGRAFLQDPSLRRWPWAVRRSLLQRSVESLFAAFGSEAPDSFRTRTLPALDSELRPDEDAPARAAAEKKARSKTKEKPAADDGGEEQATFL